MPQHLVAQAANSVPSRFAESPNDVFLMVKGFVSDTELCQDVLVVWPGAGADTTMNCLSRIASNQVPGQDKGTVVVCIGISMKSMNPWNPVQVLRPTWNPSGRTFWWKWLISWRNTMSNMHGESSIFANWLVWWPCHAQIHPEYSFFWQTLWESRGVQWFWQMLKSTHFTQCKFGFIATTKHWPAKSIDNFCWGLLTWKLIIWYEFMVWNIWHWLICFYDSPGSQ